MYFLTAQCTLDECRIYNRALSGQEVHELYDGLHAWYKFDEGSGTVAVDASVGGNNGTINGATWTAGKNGGGLGFDGRNDYVQASESPSLNISGNAITLSTWVNYRDTNKHQIFIAKPFNASSHLSPYFSYSLHGLFVNSTQIKPRFWLSIGGTGKSITSSELISPESWYHIVGVYDGSTMKIYVNGVERGSIAVSGNISSYSTPLRLGANGGFTEYFSGTIDDVH